MVIVNCPIAQLLICPDRTVRFSGASGRNAAEAWYGLLRWKWSSQIRKCRCCPYRSVMGSTAAGISLMAVVLSTPASHGIHTCARLSAVDDATG